MEVVLIDAPLPRVRRLLLNRPAARNAIDASVRAALTAALKAAEEDDNVRAVVLGGTGKMFSAGGDLPSLAGISTAEAESRMREGHAIVMRLWHFPKPVVVALEGIATGAGAGIALLGDHIVMGAQSRIGFPFLKIGLIPDWGVMTTLPLRCGAGVAARILRDSETLGAERALALHIADELSLPDEVMDRSLQSAEQLTRLPLEAFGLMKAALRAATDMNGALAAERRAQVACIVRAEFAEGYRAFREKRPAEFTNISSERSLDR